MVQRRLKFSDKWLPVNTRSGKAIILEYFFDEDKRKTLGKYRCDCGNRGIFYPSEVPKQCNNCRLQKLKSKFHFRMKKIEKEQLMEKLKGALKRKRLKELEIK